MITGSVTGLIASAVPWIFVFLLSQTATGVIGANVRKLAQNQGWDNFLARLWGADWEIRRKRWWLWLALGLTGGLTLMHLLETLYPGAPEQLGFVKTELHLQFFGGAHDPQVIGDPHNIYRWYAAYSASLEVHWRDKQGNEIVPPGGSPRYDPTWDIFVVLDKPAVFKQLIWKFSDPSVRGVIADETPRSFVLRVMTSIPAGELVISGLPLQR